MAKLSQKIAIAPLQISLIARLGILDQECEKVAGKESEIHANNNGIGPVKNCDSLKAAL